MKKILIIEDEIALRDVYTLLFKFHKFEVFSAENGKIAMGLLQKHKPDIIILDILMPVMSGVEFLETVNVKQNYPKTKVLVLSNLSDQKTIDKVMKLGADKYSLKSGSSPTALYETVQALLAGSK